jgi:hypothetical protein
VADLRNARRIGGPNPIETEGLKYDGFRLRAEAKLAGKLYGQRFGVDVAFGDPILEAKAPVSR